jgi:phosphoribosylpyrophosphate synthetase
MVANLLNVAGVNHVITIDLHATQMQGFFKCPVDNLRAEPLLARWIKHNVEDWSEGVVVSKNPGGTKRVTSLADALKLNFGIVTTDRRRFGGSYMGPSDMLYGSQVIERFRAEGEGPLYFRGDEDEEDDEIVVEHRTSENGDRNGNGMGSPPPEMTMGGIPDFDLGGRSSPAERPSSRSEREHHATLNSGGLGSPSRPALDRRRTANTGVAAGVHTRGRNTPGGHHMPSSPLARSTVIGDSDLLSRVVTAPAGAVDGQGEEFTDEVCWRPFECKRRH